MAKALFFVLACALIVAALADYEMNDDTLEFFETEKRGMGRNLKKYKYCQQYNMDCWCNRRNDKVVFCNGAGDGNGI
ncbi:uncharacterized protein LOC129271613 [Lytechinus pictus]|uniref:uncharacterized protein LOC129271613 n=1 Tax=Lytechinus pictus TaxID=7653 RepID=UPI00240D8E02|nr:uncharacterized protein LOC129271613 [Lytechinus pictus]